MLFFFLFESFFFYLCFVCYFSFFFFFSSRRRHTRWPRDWSSDVCSSDLDNHKHLDTFPYSTVVTGSAAQFNRSVSAMPAIARRHLDVGEHGHGGYTA